MADPAPFATLQQMAGGYAVSRSLHCVAELGVADVLGDEPRTAEELAAATGANPDALRRVLRLLAAQGVFATENGRFRHSAASRLLRADHPQSMRAFARMFGLDTNWRILERLDHSLKTGAPAAEKVLPEGFWARLAAHPEEGRIFNAAMVAKAQGQVPAIVASGDFSRFSRIADIGGGQGHLLQAVLTAAPRATGVLFDLPHVVQGAAGIASERLRLQGGDFFKDDLPASDGYLVMEIIHDWPDEQSVAILKAIRRAAPKHAKLLLIETIVPADPGPHWSKTLDVFMLALLGGRQRTRGEYEALLESAGFALEREIDTHADISILEARVR
jgi:O-methyltransferase/methyltransferase family protein